MRHGGWVGIDISLCLLSAILALRLHSPSPFFSNLISFQNIPFIMERLISRYPPNPRRIESQSNKCNHPILFAYTRIDVRSQHGLGPLPSLTSPFPSPLSSQGSSMSFETVILVNGLTSRVLYSSSVNLVGSRRLASAW
jgi:hypothetical protein